MAGHGITFGVISRPQDVPDDQQAVASGAVVETAIPEMPRTLANPIRLGFAEQQVARPAPALGQHSDEILAEAGLSGIAACAKRRCDERGPACRVDRARHQLVHRRPRGGHWRWRFRRRRDQDRAARRVSHTATASGMRATDDRFPVAARWPAEASIASTSRTTPAPSSKS
jgi:hypothetical protein